MPKIKSKFSRTSFIIYIVSVLCYFAAFDVMSQSSEQNSPAEQIDEDAAHITGRVIWDSHDLSRTTVQVYTDKSLRQLYSKGILLKGQGEYDIYLKPGTYYLVAFVDENSNGKFDAGDGMGIYGITDWNDKKQQKKAVRTAPREQLGHIDIPITAKMMNIDGVPQILSVKDIGVQKATSFQLELEQMSTGISGRVLWSEHSVTNALVLAYTDLSLNYRAGQAIVHEDGTFTLNVPQGKYYLLAIIDGNNTNQFDTSDEFGVYGISNLRKDVFPKPVLVEQRQLTQNVEIAIVGKQEADGRIISLPDGEEIQFAPEPETVKLSGTIIWPEHAVKNGIVQIYKDNTLTRPIKQVNVDDAGSFNVNLPPGEYYIVANVDADSDDKYSAGDGVGGYGTTDITQKPPAKVTLKEGESQNAKIFISGKYDVSGQLRAIPDLNLTDEELPFEGSGISGKIIWEGQKFTEVLLLISETPDFAPNTTPSENSSNNIDSEPPVEELSNPMMVVPMEIGEDGKYAYPLASGDYYVMAIVDVDADNRAGTHDGVGMYGTRAPMTGKPQQVSVFQNRITPYINVYIRATYVDDQGGIAQIDDAHRMDFRQQYGEPEDIYQFKRFGRLIEEWWYWTQGRAFTFEAVGPGWKLIDSETFKPKAHEITDENSAENNAQSNAEAEKLAANPEEMMQNSEQNTMVNTVIYYSYDDVVWGLAPNGTQEPLGLGSYPTSTVDGSNLSIIDIDGNVRLIDADNPNGTIILDRSDMASDPVISPDGLYLAFVRRNRDRSQIYVIHIPSDEETPLPSLFLYCYTPAWNAKSEILAFAAAGNIENKDEPEGITGRNIYFFDNVEQRVDPISIGPEDDAEASWSPTNPDMLVFSRAEDNHRQIWLVVLDSDSEPQFRQLTQFGGQKPAWLPNGNSIVYESNGQLWTINSDGSNERPLLIRGEPVFGKDPYAR